MVSSSTFNADVWAINPGNQDTFPWLHAVALQFEEFRFHALRFEYVATSGDALNSTNAALGAIVMTTQYNATNPPFASKYQMENYEGSVSVKPSKNAFHSVNCIRSQTPMTPMYVQSVAQQVSSQLGQGNILQYQLGQFYLAATGMQVDNYVCGELWVSYDVTLLKPRLNPYQSLLVPLCDLYRQFTAATITELDPLGTDGNHTNPINTLGTTYTTPGAGQRAYWTMPPADPIGTVYRVQVYTTITELNLPVAWQQVICNGMTAPADGVAGTPEGHFVCPVVNSGTGSKETTLMSEFYMTRKALPNQKCQFQLYGLGTWNLDAVSPAVTVIITYFHPTLVYTSDQGQALPSAIATT